ncbi:MAG TPA: VWA domain-containing protein [Candidatus Limnocylindrales bacterium]|nr:VWA domain-containing protein [Candidatus Limnocylindrales bacterium]
MTFLWPPLLLAVLLVPAGAWIAMRLDRRRRARVTDLSGTGLANAATPSGRRLLDRLPAALAVAGFTVLALALARPQATVALPRLEGTLMLVFDVSGSMAADDVAPNRMEVARAAGLDLVGRRPEGVVIGVVAFSDAGVAVQPPTSDSTAVEAAIARLEPTRGTSLGAGILAALDAIEKARAQTPAEYYSNRSPDPSETSATPEPVEPGSDAATLVVVLSDGENNERPNPLEAAAAVADRGIRIVSVGIGTPEGAVLDLDGFRVETSLDEATLRGLADATGGSYAAATDGDPATGVYDELARALVVRDEPLELTGLVASLGLVLLLGGTALSLLRGGRLP